MTLSRKLFWISVLYFAEGFPFGIAYDVWPVYFRVHGVSLKDIGLMSLLFLPYTLKPAWAPLVDRLGSRQAWISTLDLGLAGVALLLMVMDPTQTGVTLWLVLLTFTLLSATSDVAIDAFAVDVSTPEHSGHINGVRVSAYRVALIAAGGLLLVFADWFGWRVTWALTAVILVGLAAAAWVSPRAPRESAVAAEPLSAALAGRVDHFRLLSGALAAALIAVAVFYRGPWIAIAAMGAAVFLASFLDPSLLRWLVRREMLVVVAFALLYKVGDSALGRMVKPFWVDQGLSPSEIGLISSSLGMALTIAGALLGGWFSSRKGIYQGLLWCGALQCLSNFGYVLVATLGLGRWPIYGASVFESFTQGLGTAAFLAFLTSQCDREHAATQFALLSATFALSRDVAGALSGWAVESWGYGPYFTFTAFLALPALALLPWLRPRIPVAVRPSEAPT